MSQGDKKYHVLDVLWLLVLAVVLMTVVVLEAYGTERDEPEIGEQEQSQNQDQYQDQNQDQFQTQEQSAAASVTDSSSVDQNVNFNSARRAPATFLYMQNQVEACGRTFGFSGSNTSGGWTFGIPIPRKWTPTCDLWKAAEEAQQNGFVFTSYLFQCSISAVRKVLGDETCNRLEVRALAELAYVPSTPDHDVHTHNEEFNAAKAKYDGEIQWLQEEQATMVGQIEQITAYIERPPPPVIAQQKAPPAQQFSDEDQAYILGLFADKEPEDE